MEVTFLSDGRPCLVLLASEDLRNLAEFVDRSDRSEVHAGRLPCASAGSFVAAARHVLAVAALVPHPVPASASEATPTARWLSTKQAADLLRVSERAVRKRIATGSLPARMLGGRWLIDIKEIPDATAA